MKIGEVKMCLNTLTIEFGEKQSTFFILSHC